MFLLTLAHIGGNGRGERQVRGAMAPRLSVIGRRAGGSDMRRGGAPTCQYCGLRRRIREGLGNRVSDLRAVRPGT